MFVVCFSHASLKRGALFYLDQKLPEGHKTKMATFQEAKENISTCDTRAEKLARMKALLDATEEAMFNSVLGGGVTRYKVNTGQTIIEVESSSTTELRKQWSDLLAFYNELCQKYSGSNVMVMRPARTSRTGW